MHATPAAPFSLDMRLDTKHLTPRPPLPDGFAVRSLDAGEEAALVRCHRAAWNPHALPWPERHRPDLPAEAASSLSESALADIQTVWPYRQDLVIVAEAPDGMLAASCIAWLDEANAAAEIEPLGVVPEHRRLGLGRAVCLEAVNRVGRLGGLRGDHPPPRRRRVSRCAHALRQLRLSDGREDRPPAARTRRRLARALCSTHERAGHPVRRSGSLQVDHLSAGRRGSSCLPAGSRGLECSGGTS